MIEQTSLNLINVLKANGYSAFGAVLGVTFYVLRKVKVKTTNRHSGECRNLVTFASIIIMSLLDTGIRRHDSFMLF